MRSLRTIAASLWILISACGGGGASTVITGAFADDWEAAFSALEVTEEERACFAETLRDRGIDVSAPYSGETAEVVGEVSALCITDESRRQEAMRLALGWIDTASPEQFAEFIESAIGGCTAEGLDRAICSCLFNDVMADREGAVETALWLLDAQRQSDPTDPMTIRFNAAADACLFAAP